MRYAVVTGLPLLVVAHPGQLELEWPQFLPAFREGVRGHFELEVREVPEPGGDLDLTDVWALVLFDFEPTQKALAHSRLQIVGGVTDGRGIFELDHLRARGIPFVDATAGWAQSVAEFTMGLMIASLRRIPLWHRRLASGWAQWTYPFGQYCDDADHINGTIAGKSVGIVGLGEIGGRVARWCSAFGARVSAYDPFVASERFSASGAMETDLDTLIAMSDIVVVAVPKTASSVGMIDSRRVDAIASGSLVITVTRTIAIDVSALRKRVVRNELFWASDVFDVEPLPVDDPILNRPNVVHTPHIAGRTGHANEEVARILATEFVGYLSSSAQPPHALTPERVRVRLGASSLKEREQLRLQASPDQFGTS
jgi:phosphoglycerate dehydrogenase-like enzyme